MRNSPNQFAFLLDEEILDGREARLLLLGLVLAHEVAR